MSSEVNEYFLECVSISELLGFDEHLRELFEDTFYSVAVGQNDSTDGNNDSINVNQQRSLNDIIQYFLKNWKNMKDYSGITKSLATIITGYHSYLYSMNLINYYWKQYIHCFQKYCFRFTLYTFL